VSFFLFSLLSLILFVFTILYQNPIEKEKENMTEGSVGYFRYLN
jgi:hypothetical protein